MKQKGNTEQSTDGESSRRDNISILQVILATVS